MGSKVATFAVVPRVLVVGTTVRAQLLVIYKFMTQSVDFVKKIVYAVGLNGINGGLVNDCLSRWDLEWM